MQSNKVIVVIPVYKAQPDKDEAMALRQALKILRRHPILLVYPDKLPLDAYFDIGFTRQQATPYRSDLFKDISAYNKWLCSKHFYTDFSNYDFVLIFQSDAWVFRDDLIEWCDKDYDYIGSPWLWKPEQVRNKVRIDLWPLLRNQVGNGGVSLRKTSTMMQYAGLAVFLFRLLKKNEDFIWLLVSRLPWVKMKKPMPTEALQFCVEMNPDKALDLLNNKLPFSTHAYIRYGREFWKKHIPI